MASGTETADGSSEENLSFQPIALAFEKRFGGRRAGSMIMEVVLRKTTLRRIIWGAKKYTDSVDYV
jgi:hypothetical protein